jgi:hypothetical protein
MQHYTTAQLALAATYEQDRALATLARKVATATFEAEAKGTMGLGEWKALLLSGGCPDLIEAELKARNQAEQQEQARARAVQNLALPAGYRSSLEGPLVFIHGPFSDALNLKLKALGGHWVTPKKAWGVPIAQGERLAETIREWAASTVTKPGQPKPRAKK